MLGLGMNRDAVEDFLGRACAKSLECLYPGLKCRRGHLGGSRVVRRVKRYACTGRPKGLTAV